MTPYNLYQGFKEKNFMEIVKRKPRIYIILETNAVILQMTATN